MLEEEGATGRCVGGRPWVTPHSTGLGFHQARSLKVLSASKAEHTSSTSVACDGGGGGANR